MMKTGFIGAGRIAFSLGRYFAGQGIQVTGYTSRHEESAKKAAAFTGTSFFQGPDELIDASDAIFLTVPDSEIRTVFLSLDRNRLRGKEIIHCSGSLSAEEAFPGAEENNIVPISIHPLYPFSDRLRSYEGLGGVFFCLEGPDEGALQAWEVRLQAAGLRTRILPAGGKAAYHLACVEMSNMICGLASLAAAHLQDVGFSEAEALTALRPLFAENAAALFEKGPAAALTGPVERGDIGTLKKHLTCMEGDERDLYLACARILGSLAQRKNPGKDYSELYTFLKEAEAE